MSTKRLSRTVLEKGRGNVYERRQSIIKERREIRDWTKKVCSDPELAEEEFEPTIRPVHPEFTDKLNPVNRFIESQVGNNWSDVRSLIKQKFDIRSLAGWHIVNAHIIGAIYNSEREQGEPIDFENEDLRFYQSYYIDENNILRKTKSESYRAYNKSRLKTKKEWEEILKHYDEVADWLHGRKIGFEDGVLFWYTCGDPKHFETRVDSEYYGYHFYWGPKAGAYEFVGTGKWNQEHRLTVEEVNYFRALPDKMRKFILDSKPKDNQMESYTSYDK